MLRVIHDRLKEKAPLVHCITNYVAANACANILLACGASPVMACHPAETAEIAQACDALCLNLGTMHEETLPAMLSAGRAAAVSGKPILLDPVGAGASSFRRNAAWSLLKKLPITAIRCNTSELLALLGEKIDARGVDSSIKGEAQEAAGMLSERTGAVVAVTGAVDAVAYHGRTARIANGSPLMRSVTGAGCQLSAMAAAYLAAEQEHPFEAVIAAVCAMGVCGEIAQERMGGQDGSASYGVYLIDAVYRLTGDELKRRGKYEMQ